MKRRLSILVALCGLIGLLAAAIWLAAGDRLLAWSWDREALRTPTEQDLAEATTCHALGWRALVRLVGADADVPCGESALTERIAEVVRKHPDRRNWAQARAAPGLRHSERLRWSIALYRVGMPPPALSRLSRSAAPPANRRAHWVAELAAEDTLPAWVDPALAAHVALHRLENTEAGSLSDIGIARRAQLDLPETRTDPVAIASNTIGIPLNRIWEDALRGAPLRSVPTEMVPLLSRRIRECSAARDPRCLDLILDLAEEVLAEPGVDRAPVPLPPKSLASPLWEILHPEPKLQEIADEEVAAWRLWADANGLPAVQAALLDGRAADRSLQLARAGDPLAALHLAGSTPWATVLAARLLAPDDAQAGETAQGAALTLAGTVWLLPRCGAFSKAPPEFQPPPPLADAEIVGRAATEVAAAAARAGRRITAHQAAALALRIDPATRPAASAIDSLLPPTLDAAANAGRQAGALLSARGSSADALEAGELRDPCQ